MTLPKNLFLPLRRYQSRAFGLFNIFVLGTMTVALQYSARAQDAPPADDSGTTADVPDIKSSQAPSTATAVRPAPAAPASSLGSTPGITAPGPATDEQPPLPDAPADQTTANHALKTFLNALHHDDLKTAAACVVGSKAPADLSDLDNGLKELQLSFSTPLVVATSVINTDTTLTIDEGMVRIGSPSFEVEPLKGKVTLSNQAGPWQIEPGDPAKLGHGLDSEASLIQTLATFFVAPPSIVDQFVKAAALPACKAHVKLLVRATLECVGEDNAVFNFDGATFKMKIQPYLQPYLKTPASLVDFFHCPLDPNPGDSYSLNGNVAHLKYTDISNPATTVLIYEGHDAQLDFRHDGRAVVAFVDGHLKTVTRDEAATLQIAP